MSSVPRIAAPRSVGIPGSTWGRRTLRQLTAESPIESIEPPSPEFGEDAWSLVKKRVLRTRSHTKDTRFSLFFFRTQTRKCIAVFKQIVYSSVQNLRIEIT